MIKVLSVARKNMRARAVIAVMAALFMASAVTAMERGDKLVEKVFKNIQLPALDAKVYKSKYPDDYIFKKHTFLIDGEKVLKDFVNQSFSPINPNIKSNNESFTVGKDNRKKVENPEAYPHSANVYIEMNFGDDISVGSGVMIGPRHVLTAGHNAFNQDSQSWAKSMVVSPGASDGNSRFGTSSVVKAMVPDSYFKEGEVEDDLAVLILEKDLGKYTGWAGITPLEDDYLRELKFFVSGYPGDKKPYGQLWEMEGKVEQVNKKVLKYEIATYGGQSGSPLWKMSKDYTNVVVGIHVRGATKTSALNEATRISRERLDWIISCLTANSSSLSVKTGQQIVLKTEDSKPSYIEHPIPTLAKGYEEIYQRFFKGELIYRPQGIDKTEGEVRLRIADLKSPLEGTFDLSKCGDAGNYLSINTGYRKGMKQENADKVEIWLTPRFLVEKEQSGSAKHLQPIMSKWSKDISVGVLYTWGGWDDMSNFDYNIITSVDLMSKKNLYEILCASRPRSCVPLPLRPQRQCAMMDTPSSSHFLSPHFLRGSIVRASTYDTFMFCS